MEAASDSDAAILVMERGALWPGPLLDWAQDVSVVEQGSRANATLMIDRVRRIAQTYSARLRSIGCILVSFADAPSTPGPGFREDLVKGLGSLAQEIGCRRLILAAYDVRHLDFGELLALSRKTPFNDTERIEICVRQAGSLHSRPPRSRP